jgi:FxsC-like protein
MIFPVLWVPPQGGKFPEAITSLQYTHDDFPQNYPEEGLRYLMKLSRYKDDYEQFVSRLARKMVDAARTSPVPDLQGVRPLTEVPSAFQVAQPAAESWPSEQGDPNNVYFVFVVARRGELHGMRTSLDGYHEQTGWFWRPYYPDVDTVGLLAQEIASRLKLRYREVDLDQSLLGRLRELERAKAAVIFVADAWSVRLGRYADTMRRYDEETLANCAVLVPWNDADPETTTQQEALKQALQTAFPRKFILRPPSHRWDSIRSLKDLREQLEKVVNEVRMTVSQMADARKAVSDELTKQAWQQGISLNTSPNLTGPIGGSR